MLFALLTGRGTSPVIEFVGPASCGKSTAASLLQDLVDPVKGAVENGTGLVDMASVKQEHMVEVVSDHYFTAFDNVSMLRRETQDTLCQISTGVAKKHRIMYVGNWVKIFAKRPILMTSLASVITRPDLESRKEVIDFGTVKNFRIPTPSLMAKWKEEKPFLFLGLLHLLQDALARKKDLRMLNGVDSRRAWYTLADPLFYDAADAESIQEERDVKSASTSAENSPFVLGILAFLQDKEHKGETAYRDRMLHMFESYAKFLGEKSGTEASVGKNGMKIRWKIDQYKGAIPEKVAGFGWELSKYARVIETIGGWDVYSRKWQTREGITREFFKIIPDELEDL
jgi:ABC-type oligopeptide transport system ATPase subunit